MKPARSTYRALAAGAVIALAAGIAACGGSDAPAPTPTSRPAAEVTDGTTPTPAVVETDEATEPAEPADPADPTEPDEPQWIIDTEQKTPAEGTTGNVTVAGTTVTVGNPDAEKRAHIYMDFFCPHCVTLHELMADDLEEWAAGDDVAVEYTLVDYLGPRTTHIYSARAANLLAYVADTDPASYTAVMDALLAAKPETTTEEVTDEHLLQIARDAGATLGEDAPSALARLSYYRWVEAGTQEAAAAGITGIPQVWVDGARVAGDGHEATAELVREALGG